MPLISLLDNSFLVSRKYVLLIFVFLRTELLKDCAKAQWQVKDVPGCNQPSKQSQRAFSSESRVPTSQVASILQSNPLPTELSRPPLKHSQVGSSFNQVHTAMITWTHSEDATQHAVHSGCPINSCWTEVRITHVFPFNHYLQDHLPSRPLWTFPLNVFWLSF